MILCHVLSRDKSAIVKLPDDISVINEYQEAVKKRHLVLGEEGVAFSIDGTKLLLEQAGTDQIQSMFYIRYTILIHKRHIFFAPFAYENKLCARLIVCFTHLFISTMR